MKGSSIEGLWVILVADPDEQARKVPLLARTKSGLYLLAWKTGLGARKFLADTRLGGAEERLVVRANLDEVTRFVNGRGVAGVIVDYDAEHNTYRDAGLVY